jgi:hypothetical protein
MVMDFSEVYRLCKRSQSLKRGVKSVRDRLDSSGVQYIALEEVTVNYFAAIPGYRFTTIEGTAFFPRDLTKVPNSLGVTWVRDALIQADIVVPPYYAMGFVGSYASRILSARTDQDKLDIGSEMLRMMYPSDGLAQLICGVWALRQTYETFHQTLIESAKAYSVGLHSVAIIGLLPCIEGIIRALGVKVGLRVEAAVNIHQLLRVFDRLKSKELDMMFDGYDWLPSDLNSKLLSRFHERVQMYDGISEYFSTKLYQHTSDVSDSTSLNRHGIAHGLFYGYATAENYLRLFNLLSALSMVAAIAEGKGSMLHPGASDSSRALTQKLEICRAVARSVR